MSGQGRALRGLVLALVLMGLVAPILLGLWQTALAAFGLLPALGFDTPSLEPWRRLFALPGLAGSLRLSLVSGFGATAISFLLALALCARLAARPSGIARLMAPLLAVPHAAMAVGLAFVLAPSGWIARALAGLAGWSQPPDLASVNDGLGLALMLGLVVKELPFLVLVLMAALSQLPARQLMAAGRALGYGPGLVWVKILLPQLWPLIRLPVWAVLAYGLSTVEMALILGPSSPPTLAVAVLRLYAAPDLATILPASAGALVQAGMVAGALALVWGGEQAARPLGRIWLRRGGRHGGRRDPGPVLWVAGALARGALGLGLLALAGLVLWSLAWRWPFPWLWPQSWSLQAWRQPASGWLAALGTSLTLAGVTTALALALALAWLEAEDRARRRRAPLAEALIYLPLLLPQIGFLYGLNRVFLPLGLSGGLAGVAWGQLLFVFPYVMIALSDPWRALDPRISASAAALGAGPWRRLVAVKLPLLLRPILTAAAIGVAVSVAQYLPTLFLGGGRVVTLTTEGVALASGGDRRIAGVYASLQAALPLAAYLAALALPALLQRNRRDLTGGTGR